MLVLVLLAVLLTACPGDRRFLEAILAGKAGGQKGQLKGRGKLLAAR
jgi:hypothetical protein